MTSDVVSAFWQAMATNDFDYASQWLDPAFEYYMPQTGEVLRGRKAFSAVNTAYPTDSTWKFRIRKIVSDGQEAVSDVEVSDGKQYARAVTFHTIHRGLITRQVEYWPDNYAAPAWRGPWTTFSREFPF
ncbi:nuclear transport factor 2 family protein [Roseibium sp. RKSG952]|uniref:nuclear transport factor 2 family protein n=1 Tax=Roseibium sp. RKSG952 TaxID=2529384 RepID=UPI0012BB9847|nr:nuclear transport factor 2 family protein [Roseibium sp. RKSG952]MTH99608.1 nuclear transport factor 2 family protein [Roseibium sp. RKSG952]